MNFGCLYIRSVLIFSSTIMKISAAFLALFLAFSTPAVASAQEDPLRNIPQLYRSLFFIDSADSEEEMMYEETDLDFFEEESEDEPLLEVPQPAPVEMTEWPSWIGEL